MSSMNDNGRISSSWLSIGKSFNASLSIVPASHAPESLIVSANHEFDDGDMNGSSISSDESVATSSTNKKKTKDERKDRNKKKDHKEKKEKKERKKTKKERKKKRKHDDVSSEDNNDVEDWGKRSSRRKSRRSREKLNISDSLYSKEMVEEYRKYKEDFDSSTSDEERDANHGSKLPELRDRDRGLLIQDVPTSSSLILRGNPPEQHGLSWNLDRKPDMDIPLFVGFRYYPTQINAPTDYSDQPTQHEKKNESLAKTKYRDERYFGRNNRYLVTDPNVAYLQIISNKEGFGMDQKNMVDSQRFLLSSFLPCPVLDTNTLEQLRSDHVADNDLDLNKETERMRVVNQSAASNKRASEISKHFNSILRENSCDIVACLSFVNVQMEIFRLQKEASGKYCNAIDKLKLVDRLSLINEKSILEKQVSIMEDSIRKIEHNINMDDGNYGDILELSPLYCKLWNCQKLLDAADKVIEGMKKMINNQPLISQLFYQFNLYQKTIYSESSYDTAKSNEQLFYSTYGEKLKNLLTIQQLSVDVLSGSSFGNTEKRSLRSINSDLSHVYLDRLLVWMRYEMAYGHTEMAVALIQAMLSFNSPVKLLQDWQNNFGNLVKVGEMWDSEVQPRYGEQFKEFLELENIPPDDVNSVLQSSVITRCECMKEMILPEYSKLFEQLESEESQRNSQVQTNDTLPEPSKENEFGTDALQPQWVYSRIHGHKILIVPEDSRKTYKKILQEIGAANSHYHDEILDEQQPSVIDLSRNSNSSKKWHSFEENDVFVSSYFKDFVSSIVQDRPLRSILERDLTSLENQPERAILYDDFKTFLSFINTGQSEVNDLYLSFHVKLLIMSLGTLGIHLRNATFSHDFLGKTYFDTVTQINHEDCHNFIEDISMFWNQSMFGNFQSNLEWVAASCGFCNRSVTVDPKLIDQYCALYNTNYPTTLGLVIALIEQALEEYKRLPLMTLSWRHSKILGKCISQLRSLLIEFICLQGLALLNMDSSTILLKEKVAIRKHVMNRCLQILESSVNKDASDFGASAFEIAGRQQNALRDSCVGDLVSWKAFIASDIFTQNKEALKFAHTILSQLSESSLQLPLSEVNGILPFYWAVVALLLEIPVHKTINPSFISTFHAQYPVVLRTIVQLGCSNAIIGNTVVDPSADFDQYGYYTDWLLNGLHSMEDLRMDACSYAFRNFHAVIAMELQALTNGIQVHNAKLQAAKESKAIRIYDLSPLHSFDQLPDIFYAVLLLAWGTFVMELNFKIGDWCHAINAGDFVFKSTIDVIRSILISEKAGSGEKASIASLFGLGKLSACSFEESCLIVCLENLYQSRLQFLSYVYSLSGYVHSLQYMNIVASEAVQDFPLSSPLLQFWTTLKMVSVSGYASLRSYWNTIENSRLFWGGGITTKECWFQLQAEFIHAIKISKQSVIDPCGNLIPNANVKRNIVSRLVPDWKWLLRKVNFHEWPEDRFSRLEAMLEGMVNNPNIQHAPWLWRLYWVVLFAHHQFILSTFPSRKIRVSYLQEAKKVALRGIQVCGYCKALYMDMLGPLRGAFSEKELLSITQLMETQGIYIRC